MSNTSWPPPLGTLVSLWAQCCCGETIVDIDFTWQGDSRQITARSCPHPPCPHHTATMVVRWNLMGDNDG